MNIYFGEQQKQKAYDTYAAPNFYQECSEFLFINYFFSAAE